MKAKRPTAKPIVLVHEYAGEIEHIEVILHYYSRHNGKFTQLHIKNKSEKHTIELRAIFTIGEYRATAVMQSAQRTYPNDYKEYVPNTDYIPSFLTSTMQGAANQAGDQWKGMLP